MSGIQTLTIDVPVEIDNAMQDALDAGEYASRVELVEDALRGWTELRVEASREDLRAICQRAIADKRPGLDPDVVFDRLEKRYLEMAEAVSQR